MRSASVPRPHPFFHAMQIWGMAFAAILVVSFSALSNALQDGDPARAFWINPFNSDARVNWVSAALAGGTAIDLARIENELLSGLSSDAGDARIYSLLAEIEIRRGNADRAQELFKRALALSKTERLALRRMIGFDPAQADMATDRIDLRLRRRPRFADPAATALSPIVADTLG